MSTTDPYVNWWIDATDKTGKQCYCGKSTSHSSLHSRVDWAIKKGATHIELTKYPERNEEAVQELGGE